ncbi:MAG: sulfurtransferase [Kurthia sp.]|nr:sulfurtransferase [Candidatus Kurthia equi]
MGKVFVHAKDITEKEARWIDTRFDLMNVKVGKELYEQGHIAGAVYWDLEQDLSDMTKVKSGRHPMPEKEQLQQLFEKSGLNKTQPIYIYDQGGAPFATRAYWLLQYAGFENMKIVLEGFDGLIDGGHLVTTAPTIIKPTKLQVDWQDHLYVDRNYVKEVTEGKHNKVLLDARAHARYIGDTEPLDPVAGHIPTARNFDWELLKNDNELFVNEAIDKVVSKDENIIVYCGSGVSASPVYAVLDELGYENIQLYTGSYSDWVAHYEVATGEEN